MKTNPINSRNIKILSAKIVKGETCKLSYTNKEGERTDIVSDHEPDIIIHTDLIDSFNKLIPHYIIMTEQSVHKLGLVIESVYETNSVDEEIMKLILEERENFAVTGFILNKDDEGVTLVGRKTLSNGKVFNANSPYTRFDGSYPLIEELEQVLSDCSKEVVLYLDGKQTESPQIDMFKGAVKGEEETDLDPDNLSKLEDEEANAVMGPKKPGAKKKGPQKAKA